MCGVEVCIRFGQEGGKPTFELVGKCCAICRDAKSRSQNTFLTSCSGQRRNELSYRFLVLLGLILSLTFFLKTYDHSFRVRWVRSPEERQILLEGNPSFVIAHLLGHESAGSLRSLLVRRGWTNAVSADISNDDSDLQVPKFLSYIHI